MAEVYEYWSRDVRVEILNNYLKEAPVYLALFLSNPSPNGIGTEVTGDGYERVELPLGAVAVDEETGRVKVSNDEVVQFPSALAAWGLIGWVAVFSQKKGSSGYICSAPLPIKKDVSTSDFIRIPLGGLTAWAK